MRKFKSRWKRAAAICMVLCVILSLSACGGSQSAAAPESAAHEEGTPAADADTVSAGAETADPVSAQAETAEPVSAQAEASDADTVSTGAEAADTDTASTGAQAAASGVTAAESAAESAADETVPDYAEEENWAYFEIGQDKDADLFLICPTVDTKDEYNMAMDDEEVKQSFFGALNMERGIYEDSTRMFAPYYRQAAMKVYDLTPEEREQYLEFAYKDVSAAFSWYLENENAGRPIVLAGFSQGADLCYRLLKEHFEDTRLQEQLVAVYAIGWPVTEEMIRQSPQIKPAAAENDTGVVVSFDCEAESVEDTFINPAGQKAVCINPLNWKTDSTPADKSLNAGACFTDYSGEIRQEEPGLCGCYIDEDRGVVKVTDVTSAQYPPILSILPDGAYHIYDYQFFFRNLQQNVALRVNTYMESHMESAGD